MTRTAEPELESDSEDNLDSLSATDEEAPEADAADTEAAARKIQAMQRGKNARSEMRDQQDAATKMQAVQRGRKGRVAAQERKQDSDAATKVQALQRGRPSDVGLMALLDTMHSLLALDGATQLPGTTQTLLLQATLPATVFLSALALRARYGWAQLAGALLLALAVAALLLPGPAVQSIRPSSAEPTLEVNAAAST